MYSAVELKGLTMKPKINDITLEVLREFYEIFLYPFIYTYTISMNGESRAIAVRFNTRNFCHLLGVETIAKGAVMNSELHNYRGEDGGEFYFPRTFFMEKLNKADDKNIYVDNQEQITATKENFLMCYKCTRY